ncbi:SAM-dependent methyltransferase [Phormidesmis sp. 146-12]
MFLTAINLETAPGHEVLAAAGKTVLRPGGRSATEQLFEWANFQPGETVLELASGLGTSAIALAKQHHVNVIGIEKDAVRVAIARRQVQLAGLTAQIQIIQGDIFRLNAITEQFDYVLAEAILTMQSPAGKAKILQGVADRLKPGGKFLSHELLAHRNVEQAHRDLAQAIRANATPLAKSGWTDAINQVGLAIVHAKVGKMRLLKPVQVLQDEGFVRTAKLIWNVLTQKKIRDRIVRMRQVFDQHYHDLGYVAICAVREQ